MSSTYLQARDAVRRLFAGFRFGREIGKHRRQPPPAAVYHYTSAAGFHGIVTQRALRATNFSFLNDPTEIAYGKSVVDRVLVRESVQDDEFGAFVTAVTKTMDARALSEVYVTCFTELGDDLSQWRAYGSSAAARYAVGFDTGPLKRIQQTSGDIGFARVLYDQALQESAVREMLVHAYKFTQENPAIEQAYFVSATAREIGRILPLLKSPAYHAEREWRAVLISNADQVAALEFDTSRGSIRPYVMLPFVAEEPLPIVSLRVMAPSRPEPALKAAGLLLRKSGLSLVPVHSDVPFAE